MGTYAAEGVTGHLIIYQRWIQYWVQIIELPQFDQTLDIQAGEGEVGAGKLHPRSLPTLQSLKAEPTPLPRSHTNDDRIAHLVVDPSASSTWFSENPLDVQLIMLTEVFFD